MELSRVLDVLRAFGRERVEYVLVGAGGFTPAGIGYSPLWTAHAGGRTMPTRRGETGLLEIWAPARERLSVDLLYGPGLAEWAGVGLSAAALLLMCLGRRLGLTS